MMPRQPYKSEIDPAVALLVLSGLNLDVLRFPVESLALMDITSLNLLPSTSYECSILTL
jgi:hypothetical protein